MSLHVVLISRHNYAIDQDLYFRARLEQFLHLQYGFYGVNVWKRSIFFFYLCETMDNAIEIIIEIRVT